MSSRLCFALVTMMAWGTSNRGIAQTSEPPASAVTTPPAREALPRAAVAVLAEDDDDRFLEIYLSEVAANVLREAGFYVVSTSATRVRWQARGAECMEDDVCLRRLSLELRAPTLVLIQARPVPSRRRLRISAIARTIHVYNDRIERLDPETVDGTEQSVAEALAAYTTRLSRLERPCEVLFEHPADLEFSATINGQPIGRFPVFLQPGTHRLELTTPERPGWEGSLICASGERWRATVR